MKLNTTKLKKQLILALPYILVGLLCTNLGEAWRMAEGADASEKLLSFFTTLGIAFGNPLPSLHPVDLAVGLGCGAAFKAAVYLRGKNAKHMQLLQTPAVKKATDKKYAKKKTEYVTAATVKKVHNVLRSAFHQAVKWELMEKNPAIYATVPKPEVHKREIWDAPTLFHALEVCEDERLKLAINLSFACSMRIGEILGLTWDCVDITPESIRAGKAYVYINKELQRVSKAALTALEKKDVLRVFPDTNGANKTVLVLKKPKTATSTRKVFLPRTVAEMLVQWKFSQDFTKESVGKEYTDYNLVVANALGTPVEHSRITAMFRELIEANDLPKVVFHSLRHSSITYKLKLNGGDIKAVQGDSGHAVASMVTDQYSHILDDDRKANAALIEKAFYSGKDLTPGEKKEVPETDGAGEQQPAVDPELLAKILANPEMAALLNALAKGLK